MRVGIERRRRCRGDTRRPGPAGRARSRRRGAAEPRQGRRTERRRALHDRRAQRGAAAQSPPSPFAVARRPGARTRRRACGDTGLRLEPVRRPRFYDLSTADGDPLQQDRPAARPRRAGHHRRADLHPLRGGPALPVLLDRGVAARRAPRSRRRPRPSWPRSPRPRCGSTASARW